MHLTVEKARERQAEIVANVRKSGFKEGAQSFTDAQIWQAAVDAKSSHPDAVAAHLLAHVIEGRTPPSSPTYA